MPGAQISRHNHPVQQPAQGAACHSPSRSDRLDRDATVTSPCVPRPKCYLHKGVRPYGSIELESGRRSSMGADSLWHWLIVIVVVLLLFGRGKVSEFMGEIAHGIKGFKKAMAEPDDIKPASSKPGPD